MNEVERYEAQQYDPYGSPIYQQGPVPKLISRRLYNIVLTGFVVLSFVIMAACSHITGTYEFMLFLMRNSTMFMIGTFVGSIGGIIAMSIARAKENLTLGLIGYAIFSLTFGFTTSLALSAYSMQTISVAFSATAGIMIVFGAAGILFPQFFERIQGVLFTGLLAIIVIEVVMALFGVQQTATDIVVILLFCGFIGYDVHRAATAAPTLSNALWYAIELYLDIINVFIRILSILGRRD